MDRKLAEYTEITYKHQLKMFYRWLHGLDDKDPFPDLVRWIGTGKLKHKRKLPEDILTEEEALKIINAALNIRDRAYFAVTWETGARPSELLNMKVKDLQLDKRAGTTIIRIRLNGKTGMRQNTLIMAVPYLLKWLTTIDYTNADNNTYIWTNLKSRKPVHHDVLSVALRRAAKNAGIKKHVNKYLFRHSRATFLAKHITGAQLNAMLGWKPDSKMPNVYLHLSGKDVEDDLLQLNGLETEKPEKSATRICPQCNQVVEKDDDFCTCGYPLTQKATLKLEEEKETMEQRLGNIEKMLDLAGLKLAGAKTHDDIKQAQTVQLDPQTAVNLSGSGTQPVFDGKPGPFIEAKKKKP